MKFSNLRSIDSGELKLFFSLPFKPPRPSADELWTLEQKLERWQQQYNSAKYNFFPFNLSH